MEKKSKQSVKESRYEFVCRQYFKQVNQSADRFCVELSWQWISELHKLAILYTCPLGSRETKGFIPAWVTLKTLIIVFAAFAPGARHQRKCEGFCVCVVRHVCPFTAFNHS